MTKKVIVCRDVIFAKDEKWQWNAIAEMDSKKWYIYVLNDDVEDGVTLEAPAVQLEVVGPIATLMERPRRQQQQPLHLQNCEVNLDDNGDLVHFAFLADSEPVRLADAIQHLKWQEAMNEELMAIEKNNIRTQIGFNLDVPIKIYVDNVSAINHAKNPVFHQRSRHINIQYHFLRYQVWKKNMIKLEYCRSEDQITNIFH